MTWKELRTALYLAASPLLLLGCATEGGYEAEEEVMEAPPAETEVGELEPGVGDAGVGLESGWDWGPYEEWDVDRSGDLTETEFESGFADLDLWNEWDVDRDTNLSGDEMGTTQFGAIDADADQRISESEWNEAGETWGLDAEFAELDADGDSYLGQTEYQEWFNENAWDDWDVDGDGVVGRDEAADTFWDYFDGNDDNLIDSGEWNDVTV